MLSWSLGYGKALKYYLCHLCPVIKVVRGGLLWARRPIWCAAGALVTGGPLRTRRVV